MDKTVAGKKGSKETFNNMPELNVDIYRNTALRFLGYAGHLGWLCRSFVPFQVASMISVAYVCADTFDKTKVSANSGADEKKVFSTAADSFAWHFLASFAIPGLVIHGISGAVNSLRPNRSKCTPKSRFYLLPCLLGGVTMPFIAKPIDTLTDNLMNRIRERFHDIPIDLENEENENECEAKNSLKYKWFYDQSKELTALELERYRAKLREQKDKNNVPNPNEQNGYGPKKDDADQIQPEKDYRDNNAIMNGNISTKNDNEDFPIRSAIEDQEDGNLSDNSENEDQNLTDKSVQTEKTRKPRPDRPT